MPRLKPPRQLCPCFQSSGVGDDESQGWTWPGRMADGRHGYNLCPTIARVIIASALLLHGNVGEHQESALLC